MGSGDFSNDVGMGALLPASPVSGIEGQAPQAGSRDPEKHRRTRPEEDSDALPTDANETNSSPTDDHQLDRLA